MRYLLLSLLFASLSIICPAQPQSKPPVVSPEHSSDGATIFRLIAPEANAVLIKGQWPGGWDGTPLTKGDEGTWSVSISAIPSGIWEYHYLVDGMRVIDSRNPALKAQRNPGSSVLSVPSTPPAPWDWQADIPHGTLHSHDYVTGDSKSVRSLVVYTPPGYEFSPKKNYPLLVLQHGSGDNEKSWTAHGKASWILDHLLNQGTAVPMVVVMINGHPENDGADRTETFRRELFDAALPLVEKYYRVLPDAGNRAMAGLSMGGAQTLTIGLSDPRRFAWVAAMSGVPWTDSHEELLAKPEAINANLRLLWIACGDEDFLIERANTFIAALQAKNIRHEWMLTHGNHTWPVWRDYLAKLLPRLFQPEGAATAR